MKQLNLALILALVAALTITVLEDQALPALHLGFTAALREPWHPPSTDDDLPEEANLFGPAERAQQLHPVQETP